MSKKSFFASMVVVVLLLTTWIVYSISQPPEWVGISKDKKWKTTIITELNPKGFWDGYIYWQGEGKVTISSIQLTKNGTKIHELDTETQLTKGESFNYITTTNILGYEGDVNILTVTWTDQNGSHKEIIHLKSKKRFFVIPNSIL